ncbi:MAG: dihydrofolate reductase [Rikenellaceae bacterium]|nr:dihydrofolate reductase [Rikenellaceae bacterium]
MKKQVICITMSILTAAGAALSLSSCNTDNTTNDQDFAWEVDKFDDIRVLRYTVPEFESLPVEQKELIYYLGQAALWGRDITTDQNCKWNLAVRRTLEGIYTTWEGDRSSAEWLALEKYLKKVWFANGIHHHYSGDKFTPEFTPAFFAEVYNATPDEALPLDAAPRTELFAVLNDVIFNPESYATRTNQRDGEDVVVTSAINFHEGLTQAEAEAYYASIQDPKDPRPISYGLNSKLVKENGKVVEHTWYEGGMYGAAIKNITYWLEKAASVANPTQKRIIETLISYYRSGDLRTFDAYNILWVEDTVSSVDFVNGFIETYNDPLGYKAGWESTVNFKDMNATTRTEIISENAQWFEDHSPINPAFRKAEVKGVSAKVITVAMLGGECYPATPIGINLPNADWIRKEYGSKSVTIDNITYAYGKAAEGNGFNEEFMLRAEDRERIKEFGRTGDNLHTDLHECLGHGSGQLAPGVKGDELKQYGSTLEEARADLFGLYFLGDAKMVELGLVPSFEVAKAQYAHYIMNGMMTQLARIEPGKTVEEAHMRNRKLIAEWCYERGKADNVIEMVKENGKTYVVVNDFEALRELFGELLYEVQRIKSEGDFEACRDLVERYAVNVDPELHAEVLERYTALGIAPYSGFVNPTYELITEGDKVIDVKINYTEGYTEQMLRYSSDYSPLPTLN